MYLKGPLPVGYITSLDLSKNKPKRKLHSVEGEMFEFSHLVVKLFGVNCIAAFENFANIISPSEVNGFVHGSAQPPSGN